VNARSTSACWQPCPVRQAAVSQRPHMMEPKPTRFGSFHVMECEEQTVLPHIFCLW